MFGHFPAVLRQFISGSFGAAKWEEIANRAGLPEDFEDTSIYEDSKIRSLISTAASSLNLGEEAFLAQLGDAYLRKLQSTGHSQLLKLIGATFFEFVQNIDFVHTLALAKFPKADIPLFRIDADSIPNEIILHYFSSRDYLGPMVEALLRSISREYFRKELHIRIISENTEGTFQGRSRHHVIYGIDVSDGRHFMPDDKPTMLAETRKHCEHQIVEEEVEHQIIAINDLAQRFGEDGLPIQKYHKEHQLHWNPAPSMTTIYAPFSPSIPRNLSISPRDFCQIFPYHVIFDENMIIKQAGIQIQLLMPGFRNDDSSLTQSVELVHPAYTHFNYDNIIFFIHCPHVVRIRNSRCKQLYLRGQMMELKDSGCILYMCSPYITSLSDLEKNDMYLSQLPTYDLTKYLIYGDSMTESFFKRTTKGDWIENYMGHEGKGVPYNELDGDVYSMVPPSIAEVIKSGRKVEGRLYRNVTVLFCDIVNFADMVSTCRPQEVLDLLNQLHTSFSRLTKTHDVFKVDAYGDAFVVVSGIPEKTPNHAEKMANYALGMISSSRNTTCPLNYGGQQGNQCLIRIGIHTGDLVGGIIEKPIPRFIVMGDTAILASRLESHGIPDQIQISEATYREIKNRPFEFKQRGPVEIRGRGRHNTFLLMGTSALLPSESDVLRIHHPSSMSESSRSVRSISGNPAERMPISSLPHRPPRQRRGSRRSRVHPIQQSSPGPSRPMSSHSDFLSRNSPSYF